MPQGAIWSSVYVNIQEGTLAVQLNLNNEVDVIKVVKGVFQFSLP
jgi:hypothetical protein